LIVFDLHAMESKLTYTDFVEISNKVYCKKDVKKDWVQNIVLAVKLYRGKGYNV